MASEYFLKKAKEEYKPREVHIMTAAERRKSRWYYHKRQIIIGAFFGICIIIILWNVLGIPQIHRCRKSAVVARGTH